MQPLKFLPFQVRFVGKLNYLTNNILIGLLSSPLQQGDFENGAQF